MKKILFIAALLTLAGCSSPPPLPQIKDGEAKPINSSEWIKTKQAEFDAKAAKYGTKEAAQENGNP